MNRKHLHVGPVPVGCEKQPEGNLELRSPLCNKLWSTKNITWFDPKKIHELHAHPSIHWCSSQGDQPVSVSHLHKSKVQKHRSDDGWVRNIYLSIFAVHSDILSMIYQRYLLKESLRRESGRFQVKCKSSCYLGLRSLHKSALICHSMQQKHSNKFEFKDPKIRPFLSPWTSGVKPWQFFNWSLRRVLLMTFSTSGNTAVAQVH